LVPVAGAVAVCAGGQCHCGWFGSAHRAVWALLGLLKAWAGA
jgi:hypothetical protein